MSGVEIKQIQLYNSAQLSNNFEKTACIDLIQLIQQGFGLFSRITLYSSRLTDTPAKTFSHLISLKHGCICCMTPKYSDYLELYPSCVEVVLLSVSDE